MNYNNNQNQLLVEKCEKYGLKITPQRSLIFSEIQKDTSHPSAYQVFERVKEKFPNISLDTVNRTLLSLADIGLLNIVAGRDKVKRFDPFLEEHSHFQCIKCLKIIDFENSKLNKIIIPPSLKGNTIINKKIILEGICKSCKKINN